MIKSKNKQNFKLSYVGIKQDTYSIIYHNMGEYSTVISLVNSVERFGANSQAYYDYHDVFTNIIKILGEGYTIQKHDIISKITFKGKPTDDYLSKKYFEHFKGRQNNEVKTFLTITKNVTRSNFFQYDYKEFDRFIKNITKIVELFKSNGFKADTLNDHQLEMFVKRYLALNFVDDTFTIKNFKVTNNHIEFNNDILKSVSLVDIDEIDFPGTIKPYTSLNLGYDFPTDLMGFLYDITDCKVIIYHQVIFIPNQKKAVFQLEKKKKRHTSMPDPANDLAALDIENVLNLIARTNELLVDAHYNVLLFGTPMDVDRALNKMEGQLFNFHLVPSNNCYNQLELYIGSFPGHSYDIQPYDRFFTTSDPAVSLFYKERSAYSEDSDFKIYFTDREGNPVSIDTSDLPMQTGRINNRNKFVLGPSGSGKSFFMNSIAKQYFTQDTEIVIIDTGHSYSGLCQYVGGKYITYEEDKPITMNPFLVTESEFNEEKRDFLKSLIALLWKGNNGTITQLEDSLLINLVSSYYANYFSKGSVKELSFNTFYEYSLEQIKVIQKEEDIIIDIQSYAFVLKKFYKGGEYDLILNSDVDKSLFDEPFIVFEIDNIKDNKTLFPITTLIIMDVFLQKMRHKKKRKKLIIEEAWKAIASPMMASYILYVYKTVRKFWGEAIVVTQELDDIIGNEIVKNSIINNSDTIILLDQAKFKDSYEEVASLLSLSEIERKKIFTINKLDNKEGRNKFKEVYIRRGSVGEVYGVEVSLEEYLTYTTEKLEKEAISVYLKKYEQYDDAIDNFVMDFKESNLNMTNFCKSVINKKQPVLIKQTA